MGRASHGNRAGKRGAAALLLWAVVALATPALAQTQIVVVEDTTWDWFNAPMNPGCTGCGLFDWDDVYNNGYGCRLLPSNGRGALCTGLNDPPDPGQAPGDDLALGGSVFIQSTVATRFDGLVTEFDEPDDPFPPYDPAVSGAIQSLTGTYALRHNGHNGPGSNAIEGHLLIRQGGVFYVSSHNVPASSGGGLGPWVRVGESGGVPIVFTADDFGRVRMDEVPDFSQNPDFSESGAPLFFGFALDLSYQGTLGGPPGNNFLNRAFNVDDIRIVVTTADGGDPIPALPVAGLGVLALWVVLAPLAARRRSRA